MTRFTLTVAVAALIAANGCSGRSDSPLSPTVGSDFSDTRPRNATGSLAAPALHATGLPDADAAATINLSGVWKGTVKAYEINNVEFTLLHSGKTITGKMTRPVVKNFSAMLSLSESSVKGTKRTYKVSFKMTLKGGPCSTVTQTGTIVINTATKTLTGTAAGKNTDCGKEINSFSLKKKK